MLTLKPLFWYTSQISLNPLHPKASYDSEGNIILPGAPAVPAQAPMEWTAPAEEFVAEEFVADEATVEWIIVDDEPAALHAVEEEKVSDATEPCGPTVRDRIVQLRQVTRGAVREGARQYRVSIASGKPLLQQLADDCMHVVRLAWDFLRQPVWVPARKKQIKQYSRGTLFLLDIVRFGGTFTVIFLVLFVGLNYQSFLQIAGSKVSTILSSPTIETTDGTDSSIIETLKAGAGQSADARARGELLSFLPDVGPPDNRLLIPKLHLNVPLVTPPIDALLRQDWNQVESDIQTALAEGVVHYPGTARPGQAGNFFVTGHSSYYPWAPGKYKNVFARLDELSPGDEYWVYYKGDRHRYIVTDKKEVSPTDISVLDQPEDKRESTLMTCTPVGTSLRRLIVVAQEVDPLTGSVLEVGQRAEKGATPKPQLEALPI